MKVLITGGAGFIGYHYAYKLLGQGYDVISIDNLNDYYDVRLKYARLQDSGFNILQENNEEFLHSEKFKNYRFKKIDITDFKTLRGFFKENKFDFVVNLAAQAGVRYSLENPRAYIDSNIVGFINILECCREFMPKHLIYASSSSVYGNSNDVPFSEEDRVDYPVSLYAATKKSNELMAYTYSHLYKIPTTGLRFFTVYGPWGRPDMSPIIFAKAIQEEKPIKVFNSGKMERDFTYIDDIVEGIYRVMDNPPVANQEKPFYQLLNIGNSSPIQLMDFIDLMEKYMGKEAKKEMYPMQPGDVYKTFADTSRLEKFYNYKAKVSLEEGVKKFIDWYKNQDIV